MWEWSNSLLNKKPQSGAKSLLSAYNDLLLQSNNHNGNSIIKNIDIASEDDGKKQNTYSLSEMRSIMENKLQDYNLHNFELKECPYEPQSWQEMNKFFTEFYHIRGLFLKLLGYSQVDECLKMGLNKADIKLLQNSNAPENYNTHIKIPFDFGGTLDFSNLCLVKTHPTHGLIHRLIDLQIESDFLRTHKKIFIPYKEEKFYHD